MTEYAHHQHTPRTLPEGVLEYGFSIERAPRTESYGELVPLGSVLASRDEQALDIRQRFASGNGVRVLQPDEVPRDDERWALQYVPIVVPQSEYDGYVAEGKLKTNVQDEGTSYASHRRFMNAEQAEEVGLRTLFADQERAALEAGLERGAMHHYDADYMGLADYAYEKVQGVSQIFEFESWGHKRRLYNFTKTLVTDEQLAKIMNAVREQADLTGGSAMEMLSVMAILPETSSTWGDHTNGKTHHGAVMLNEKVFKEGWRDTVGSPEDSHPVGGGELETMVFHELSHVVATSAGDAYREAAKQAGWELNEGAQMDSKAHQRAEGKKGPSDYSGANPAEHIAEIATALHAGGEWAEAVDEADKIAIRGLYASQHSGQYGPSYIRCSELDIPNLPHKLGLELRDGKGVAIGVDVNYEIKQEVAAA